MENGNDDSPSDVSPNVREPSLPALHNLKHPVRGPVVATYEEEQQSSSEYDNDFQEGDELEDNEHEK
jgi:hypothetical protein